MSATAPKVKSDQPRLTHRLTQRPRRKDFTMPFNSDSDIPRPIVHFSAGNKAHPRLPAKGFTYGLDEDLDAIPPSRPAWKTATHDSIQGAKIDSGVNAYCRCLPSKSAAWYPSSPFCWTTPASRGYFYSMQGLVAPFPLLSACTAMQRREEPPPPGDVGCS